MFDKMLPPTIEGNPVSIEFSLVVKDITLIHDQNKEFQLHVITRQKFEEPRLEVDSDFFEDGEDYRLISMQFLGNLWLPDSYFSNSNTEGEENSKLT